MKLPLKVRCDYYGRVQVIDAGHRIVLDIPGHSEDVRFARAMVSRMNRDWRYRFFGRQPFVYTRDNWLYDKSVKA